MEVYSQLLKSGERSAVVSSFQRDMQKGQSLPLGEIQPVQDVSWQEFQRVGHFWPRIQRIWLFQYPIIKGEKSYLFVTNPTVRC